MNFNVFEATIYSLGMLMIGAGVGVVLERHSTPEISLPPIISSPPDPLNISPPCSLNSMFVWAIDTTKVVYMHVCPRSLTPNILPDTLVEINDS